MSKSVTLVILDGFGLAPASPSNAVTSARTPVLDALYKSCNHTTLSASGEDVGLPDGQIGNSEVGHTNIGAGRVVYQSLSQITRDIDSGAFFENETLISACEFVKLHKTALHLLGLVSAGGVHSHTKHLYALLDMARRRGVERVYVHAFLDGRDVPPGTAKEYIAELRDECNRCGYSISTVMGRYYAMDRDNRWDRVQAAYDCMVRGVGERVPDAVDAVAQSYGAGVTDEFMRPVIVDERGQIAANDGVIFFNFRPDRARQLTKLFCDKDFAPFGREWFPLKFVTMTEYDETIPIAEPAYAPRQLMQTLGEVIATQGLRQLRAAETEKYAHVTYFFSGGREELFDGEERVLIPSPTEFATYDLVPEMSAESVANAVVQRILSREFALNVVNFANCDMVGHTGVLGAAITAVETVDSALGRVLDAVRATGGVALVTADHGNAEEMTDALGNPMTAHTVNPVPLILIGAEYALKSGRLADIAPTILELSGIAKPDVMTGESLLI
ncbi:MAG: 2,3-bisphosphoglycerate-independent phosphoglycerate mutase [Oscillospiraceae bacterium]|jgi:2,3-bisphosphoglycerate-independent phosphoglycerate mutase|nr:2,3-bisphosphoglycerate-independent phosphoglycerate mutase [Oscillospiraceae bacterium]